MTKHIDDFFNSITDKIFNDAGITKEQAPNLYKETREFLAQKMDHLSAKYGASDLRTAEFEHQKTAFVYSLRDLKKMGNLD